MELEMDCLTSATLDANRKLAASNKYQLCTKLKYVLKTGLSSSYDGWAKCKEIGPDVVDPNQNVQTTCNSKLKLTKLKDLFIKRFLKTSQR